MIQIFGRPCPFLSGPVAQGAYLHDASLLEQVLRILGQQTLDLRKVVRLGELDRRIPLWMEKETWMKREEGESGPRGGAGRHWRKQKTNMSPHKARTNEKIVNTSNCRVSRPELLWPFVTVRSRRKWLLFLLVWWQLPCQCLRTE